MKKRTKWYDDELAGSQMPMKILYLLKFEEENK